MGAILRSVPRSYTNDFTMLSHHGCRRSFHVAGHSLSGFDITQPADTMICNRQPRLILFAMQYMLFS